MKRVARAVGATSSHASIEGGHSMLPSLKRTDPSKGLQRAPLRSQHRPYQQRQVEKTLGERSLWLPPVSWGVPGRPPRRDHLPRRQMALRRGARPAPGRMCCGSRDLPRSVDQRSVARWAAVTIYRDASDWPTPFRTACVRNLSRAWARRPFSGARCACHTLLPRQTAVPACGDGLADPKAPA